MIFMLRVAPNQTKTTRIVVALCVSFPRDPRFIIGAGIFNITFDNHYEGGLYLKRTKQPQKTLDTGTTPRKRFRLPIAKPIYLLFVSAMGCMMFAQPAYAATTVWDKASQIMKDVYGQILAISTIAAIVTASVALLLMNFSRSGRTVDESRAWLKRIVITWVILNGLGFIMAYVTPFFADGKWTG